MKGIQVGFDWRNWSRRFRPKWLSGRVLSSATMAEPDT